MFFEFALCILPSNILVHIGVKVFSVNFSIVTKLCQLRYYFMCMLLLSYLPVDSQKWPKHVVDDHFIYICIYIYIYIYI